MPALQDVVALVTGASRGVGRGIALALGEAGAHVFLTGRTLETGGVLPGSLAATAKEIERRGGRATPIRCDHSNDDDVVAVFERVREQSGRLDILVNNVFAVPNGELFVKRPFWEQPIAYWDTMHSVGLRSHYVASHFAAPLLLESDRGLVANISSFGGASYQVNVAYGVGKAGVDRLAKDMARDFYKHGVCSVSLYPGIVRTERVLAGELPFDTTTSESPEFVGRAIVALANDPERMKVTGEVLVVAELAEHYGFRDIDGTQPPSLRGAK